MLEFFKISCISTIITLVAAAIMFYFARNEIDYKETYNEGLDLYRHKKYKDALSRFSQVMAKFPQKADAFYNAGLCELKLNSLKKAKNNFLEVLKLTPEDTDAIYNLGYIEFYERNYRKAKEYFTSIMDKMPNESDLLYSLGEIQHYEGHLEEAISLIKQAIEISPEKNIYKKNYQDILEEYFQETSDTSLMQEILDLSLDLLVVYPDDETIIYRAAIAYAQMGDWEKSIQYCERLYNKNPNSAKACNQYGLALFCKGEMEEAIEMYEKAIALDSSTPDIYINLIFAYDKIGDTENAIEFAQTFLKKFDNHPSKEIAIDYINKKVHDYSKKKEHTDKPVNPIKSEDTSNNIDKNIQEDEDNSNVENENTTVEITEIPTEDEKSDDA